MPASGCSYQTCHEFKCSGCHSICHPDNLAALRASYPDCEFWCNSWTVRTHRSQSNAARAPREATRTPGIYICARPLCPCVPVRELVRPPSAHFCPTSRGMSSCPSHACCVSAVLDDHFRDHRHVPQAELRHVPRVRIRLGSARRPRSADPDPRRGWET